ncbi:MAG: hypothetical protein AAF799_20580 [Myxococcota bacterium]
MFSAIKPWHALAASTALFAIGCDSKAKAKETAKTEATTKKVEAKKTDAKKGDAKAAVAAKTEDAKKKSLVAAAVPSANAKADGGKKKKGFLGGNGEPCDTELEWYDDEHHDGDANWDDAEHFGWGDFDEDEEFDDEGEEEFDDHEDEEFDDHEEEEFDDEEEQEPESGKKAAAAGGKMRQRTKEESVDKVALSAPVKQFTIKCVPGADADYRSNRTRVTLNLQGGALGFVATPVRTFSGYGGEGDRCADYRKTLTSSQYLKGTITNRKVRYFRPWDGKCHTWVNTEVGLDIDDVDFTLWGVSRTDPVDAEDDDCR